MFHDVCVLPLPDPSTHPGTLRSEKDYFARCLGMMGIFPSPDGILRFRDDAPMVNPHHVELSPGEVKWMKENGKNDNDNSKNSREQKSTEGCNADFHAGKKTNTAAVRDIESGNTSSSEEHHQVEERAGEDAKAIIAIAGDFQLNEKIHHRETNVVHAVTKKGRKNDPTSLKSTSSTPIKKVSTIRKATTSIDRTGQTRYEQYGGTNGPRASSSRNNQNIQLQQQPTPDTNSCFLFKGDDEKPYISLRMLLSTPSFEEQIRDVFK
jgi:hypothetical protein